MQAKYHQVTTDVDDDGHDDEAKVFAIKRWTKLSIALRFISIRYVNIISIILLYCT